MKKIALTTLLILLCVTVSAQEKDSTNEVHYFKGKLLSAKKKSLAFAHIINLRRSYAAVSDSAGRFRIPAVEGDSLRISTIGFKTMFYVIQNYSEDEHQIILTKRDYNLPTVNIYELRWQVFKSEFMETVSEDTKVANKVGEWMSNLISVEELKLIYQSTMAPGFRINYKSKKDKSKMKVRRMEKRYKIIAPKFNDKLISNLTGLKGKEIYKFLRYCNFSEDFLIHASEYEIMEQILVFWEEYKSKGLDK